PAGAVGDVDPLARPEPPHGRRMVPLGAGEDDVVLRGAGRVGQEDGNAHEGSAAVERVAQPGEEALLTGGELAGRPFLAAELGELPQELLLLGVELRGGLHVDVDVQVAPAGLVEPRDALAVQPDDLARLSARADVDLLDTVEGL